MNLIAVSELVQGLAFEVVNDGWVSGVKVDSRTVVANDLFVCLKGARSDGHDHAEEAVLKGATALLVDHLLDIDICQIVVSDTLAGLRALATGYRARLSAFFIAITGSNGKTSTKDALVAVLSRQGSTVATHANQNTEIGTYLTLFTMALDTRYAIFEIGLDQVGDVELMAAFIRPDAAIVTGLAPAHMMNFDSLEHLALEKMSLFRFVKNKQFCFFQGDVALYRRIAQGQQSFGFSMDNDWVISDVQVLMHKTLFSVNGVAYETNLLGQYQASNCAGIIALCAALKLPIAIVQEGLKQVRLTELRMEVIRHQRALVLLDAYKSNPVSTQYALDLLCQFDFPGLRFAVLSDMRELGAISLAMHRDLLDYIQSLDIAKVYTLGPEFAAIAKDTQLEASRFDNSENYEEFSQKVAPLFDEDVMILIKGSRYYQLERLVRKED